jgi:hypothetical protein
MRYPKPLEHLKHPLIDGEIFNFPYIYNGKATLELTSVGKKMWLEIYGELQTSIVLCFGPPPGPDEEDCRDSEEFKSMTPEQGLRKIREGIIRYQKEHYGHDIKMPHDWHVSLELLTRQNLYRKEMPIMKNPHSLVKKMTPEEIELEKKRAELSILEDDLSLKELDLTTLQAVLEDLRRRYLRIVGVKLANLDGINAKIAEILSRLDPKDEEVKKEADRSRKQADESADATGSIAADEYEAEPFKPSDDLKQLYRDLAKKIHPDLAPNEQSRERRNRFMQEVNQAYSGRNEERLRSLLHEWESSPDSVVGEGTGAELIRIIRQIASVHARIEAIGREMKYLKETELYSLKLRVDEAQDEGRDLFTEMAEEVDGRIEKANTRLIDVNKRLEKEDQKKKR